VNCTPTVTDLPTGSVDGSALSSLNGPLIVAPDRVSVWSPVFGQPERAAVLHVVRDRGVRGLDAVEDHPLVPGDHVEVLDLERGRHELPRLEVLDDAPERARAAERRADERRATAGWAWTCWCFLARPNNCDNIITNSPQMADGRVAPAVQSTVG
jgi:hypothetical protein